MSPLDRPLRILFVTARVPGLGARGDQLRAYQQLRVLGARHRITLLSFRSDSGPAERVLPVSRFCERTVTVPLRPLSMARGVVRRVFSRRPLQVGLHETPEMRQAVREALSRETYDVVHVQLVRMAPYLETARPAARVIDLVDALSVNMDRRSRHDRGIGRWLARLEAARLSRYEREVCRAVDAAVVGSVRDLEAIGPCPALSLVGNGVDLDEYRFDRAGRDPREVIFSGNLGYFPNVHAARWFARSVLPRIRHAVPGVTLRVVGARPHRTIRRLAAEDPAVVLSGDVERMYPHLRRSALAVAPIHAGSGQPLKVLEAMASGTPVVATPFAAAAIEARHEEHLLVAEEPEAFAREAIRLLRDPALADRLAAKARRFVEERYTWERSAAQLEEVYRAVTAGAELPRISRLPA